MYRQSGQGQVRVYLNSVGIGGQARRNDRQLPAGVRGARYGGALAVPFRWYCRCSGGVRQRRLSVPRHRDSYLLQCQLHFHYRSEPRPESGHWIDSNLLSSASWLSSASARRRMLQWLNQQRQAARLCQCPHQRPQTNRPLKQPWSQNESYSSPRQKSLRWRSSMVANLAAQSLRLCRSLDTPICKKGW
jgi:hypothetical protein